MKSVNNFLLFLLYLINIQKICYGMAINLLDAGQLQFHEPNYCNDSSLLEEAGLRRSPLGQFIGYPCSAEFYHCRWQSNGFLTYKKACKQGLVYDTLGTQNCNFDFNIKGCGMRSDGGENCQKNEFSCPLSESCVSLSQRCDGNYDCLLEEDEQNCPMCSAGEFPCIISEQCIASGGRCNGVVECGDGTDEMNCEGCGEGMFHCLKSSECIPISQRCDGTPQCTHGEDELLCKKTHERFYVCENRLDQVPIAQVCDGTANCPDGSDEKYCTQSPMQPPQGPSPPMPPQSASFPMANANEIADYDRIQQERYVQDQQQPEAEAEAEEEEEEEGSDDPPISPLMPRFIPTFTTTTKKPTTKIYTAAIRVEPVKLPKKPTVNPRIEVKPRPITSSISEVAVTAAPALKAAVTTRKPISYVRPMVPNREKVVASITITTTPPQVPTFPTTSIKEKEKEEETMGQIEEELIAKLGARLNNQNKFSARDILNKLETLLASSDPSGAASALVASASAPQSAASIAIPSLPKQQPPSASGGFVSSAYNSQSNNNINNNSNNNNNNAYAAPPPPIRFDPHPKTSVLDTRRFGGFGSQKLRSRVRVTGRPSSRKWRPSLSNNPSHRTTPLPQSEAEIAVQFRQSDASKTPATSVPMPTAETSKSVPPPKSTEMPKMAHPTLHKRIVSSKAPSSITTRGTAAEASPTLTNAKDALEPDETYFTYDEKP